MVTHSKVSVSTPNSLLPGRWDPELKVGKN